MTETSPSTSEKTAPNMAARIAWAALIVVTLAVCYFSNLGAIGFVGPDEPRYAWIARDMAETGDWVTPRLYGKPWFEKPVLYYWMAGASFKLFGVSEAAARLPSALCALFATLALAWLAWRVYGEETARWLLVLLPTSAGMIGFSHAAATDMPFSGMLTIAMVCAAVVLGLTRGQNTPILPRTPWLALLLFGFFLGLAVLAKGPAAIILSGGAVFFWALIAKKWRDALRLLHPAAIASFCATALPWYILCARRNPDFFRVFIIEHNFKRYLTPEFQHIQPFWYYVVVLTIELLPWSLIAAASLIGLLFARTKLNSDSTTVFVLCWALFCIVFFSISKSKLPGYVLPALPELVFLIAKVMTSANRISQRVGIAGAATGGAIFALVSLLPLLTSSRNNSLVFLPYLGILTAAFGLANLLIVLALVKRWPPIIRACLAFLAIAPILGLFAGVDVLVKNNWFLTKSSLGVATALVNRGVPPNRLRTFGLDRSTQYALNFYLHAEIKDWKQDRVEDGYVLANRKYCAQLDTKLNCEDLWGRVDFGGGAWALLRVTPVSSAPGASGSGQPR
jgi:4-amino-4-deoxy-L-arabinose transferase-like glycosyltransferase